MAILYSNDALAIREMVWHAPYFNSTFTDYKGRQYRSCEIFHPFFGCFLSILVNSILLLLSLPTHAPFFQLASIQFIHSLHSYCINIFLHNINSCWGGVATFSTLFRPPYLRHRPACVSVFVRGQQRKKGKKKKCVWRKRELRPRTISHD